MTSRRRWLLLGLVTALALLVGWRVWPDESAGPDRAVLVRSGRPAPVRVARRSQPAAPALGVVRTGIAACDRFVERSMTCAQLPDDAKIAIAEATKGWAQVTAAARRDLETSCRAAASIHAESLAAMGC